MDNLPRLIGPNGLDPELWLTSDLMHPLSEEEQEAAAVLIVCMREGRGFEAMRDEWGWMYVIEGNVNESPLAARAAALEAHRD